MSSLEESRMATACSWGSLPKKFAWRNQESARPSAAGRTANIHLEDVAGGGKDEPVGGDGGAPLLGEGDVLETRCQVETARCQVDTSNCQVETARCQV